MFFFKLKKILHSNNKIHYEILLMDKKYKPTGKFIEKIGFYIPIKNKWNHKSIYIDCDRLFFWLKRGVKLSPYLFGLIKPVLIYHIKTK